MLSCVFATDNEARQKSRKPGAEKTKTETPQARLEIDKTTWDFGDVFAGEDLEHQFAIRNNGESDLTLAEKRPTARNLNPKLRLLGIRNEKYAAVPIIARRAAPT